MLKNSNRPPAVATAGQALTSTLTDSMAHGGAAVNALQPLIDMIADAVVARLRAEQPPPAVEGPMTAVQIAAVRPWATRGWLRTHVTPVGIGARQRPLYRLSDVDAAQAVSPPQPRAKQLRSRPVDDGDEIDALIASGAVRR